MALNIKNEEADRLARELVELTGETPTEAITKALRERLERESSRVQPCEFGPEILTITARTR